MTHSKLPWTITATPKGSKQITDARGGVVANLTALDIDNAELIVASVNNAALRNQNTKCGIQHITNPDDLKEGEMYWLVDKSNDMYRTDTCRAIHNVDNTKHFGNRIWASSSNPQAFERWNIFGPIPVIEVPDFKALMTKK